MNRVTGMTIAQFNEVVEEMRGIYPFKDENAYLGDLHDHLTNEQRQVELCTRDEDTGIVITMTKGVKYD